MSALETPAVLITHAYSHLLFAAPGTMGDMVSSLIVLQASSLAQTAEAGADETRRAVTFLVLCLLAIAVGLAAMTVWYWHYTSPRRQARILLDDLGHYKASGIEVEDVLGATPNQVPKVAPNDVRTSGGPPSVGSHAVARPFAAVAPDKPVNLVPAVATDSDRIGFTQRRTAAGSKTCGTSVEAAAKAVALPKPAVSPETPAIPLMPSTKPAATLPMPDPVPSRSPITVPVASVPGPPKSPAVSVPGGPAAQGEQRAERPEASTDREEGLSDDDWAAVMQSAFKHLNR